MPIYPHRIRLRGPWECELFARADRPGIPQRQRVRVPCRLKDCGLGAGKAAACFRRRFGAPGRLDDFERLWLTFAGIAGQATIFLNDTCLGRSDNSACEFDVTSLLQPRNELRVDLESATKEDGLYGEVAMEIRRTAFLRDIQAWWEGKDQPPRLRVSGYVVGTSDRPLDLYVLLDNRTIGYCSVQPRPEGVFVAMPSPQLEAPTAPGANLRIDLVDGGVIWYTTEIPIDQET